MTRAKWSLLLERPLELVVERKHLPTAYLFGSVFERFLAETAGWGTFTRLSVRCAEDEKLWHTWPARTGTRALS